MRFLLLCLLLASCGLAGSYRDKSVPIASTSRFEPERFDGRWIEIARFPNAFQNRCAGATAEYQPTGDGFLSVLNQCFDASGAEVSRIAGRAEIVAPGRLRVQLQGVPVAAPLWVLWVDEDYQTAVLGQPDGRAGWILNRSPELRADRFEAARQILDFNGYDTARLVRSTPP